MKLLTQTMLDIPDKEAVGGAAAYGLFSYVLIPFVLYWMSFAMDFDPKFSAWGQMILHGINFATMLWLYREYLQDSFLNVKMAVGQVMRTVLVSSLIIIVCHIVFIFVTVPLNHPFLEMMLYGSMPLGESNTLLYSPDLIYFYPLLGSAIMVFITPVTVSCLFYAMSFAPLCGSKPWLAYLVVSVVLAIPRLINSFLFWAPDQELAIYLGQLPIHLIACRTYQKCDTVWAPIFCLAVANLMTCLLLVGPFVLAG